MSGSVKTCIVTFRSYRRDGNHADAIAGSLLGPEHCVMTRDEAERRVRSLESRSDRLARVREFETEEKALERARSLCLPWFARRQAA